MPVSVRIGYLTCIALAFLVSLCLLALYVSDDWRTLVASVVLFAPEKMLQLGSFFLLVSTCFLLLFSFENRGRIFSIKMGPHLVEIDKRVIERSIAEMLKETSRVQRVIVSINWLGRLSVTVYVDKQQPLEDKQTPRIDVKGISEGIRRGLLKTFGYQRPLWLRWIER